MLDSYLSPQQIEKNTLDFIRTYCQHYSTRNPRPPMRNEETINGHWDKLLRDYAWVDQDRIKTYLNNVDYDRVFLTSYWWYIIKHKRMLMDGFLCANNTCGTPENHFYNVHHKTYEHRGEEVKFMDSIVTLCKVCHDIEHENDERKGGKKKRRRRKPFKKKMGVMVFKKTETQKEKPLQNKIQNLIDAEKEINPLSEEELMTSILNSLRNTLDYFESEE